MSKRLDVDIDELDIDIERVSRLHGCCLPRAEGLRNLEDDLNGDVESVMWNHVESVESGSHLHIAH